MIFLIKKEINCLFLEDILLNKEKLCNQIADQKIKELLNQFIYIEDKIIFNEDNFYSLFKQNNNINLNIPQNNLQFDNMIRKVSKIKSEEYNNILVPKKPKWAKKKEEMSFRISEVCKNYIKQIFQNQIYKENIKYDINNLDKLINALNLSNGIEEKKHNEIKSLINEMKEKTQNQIINLKSNLLNWSETKNSLIYKGNDIINQKLESDIPTNDLNKLINILIEEVKNYLKSCDLLNDKNHYNQVFEELRKSAEQKGNSYKNKKIQVENVKKENEKIINELKKKLIEQNKAANKLGEEVQKVNKMIVEERKIRQEEEKKRKEEEKKRKEIEKKRIEEEKKRLEEEIKIKEEEIKRKEIERKKREEEERIRKENEERRIKKIYEELERIKREEIERIRRIEQERIRMIEEERKRKEEEKRKRIEDEERRRKEEEERKRKEDEERKRIEEIRRRREEEERRRREEEERRRREEEIRRIREAEERSRLYFPIPNYGGGSIVDALKSINSESSKAYRATIAARNGISGYTGAPEQNIHMLNLLKSGNLLRP